MGKQNDQSLHRMLGRAMSLGEAGFAGAVGAAARAYGDGRGIAPLVLASVDRSDDGRAVVSLIARPDSERYDAPRDDEAPLCQHGSFPDCGASLLGWAKYVACPVCGSKTYCT